jgi:hypothetical protein
LTFFQPRRLACYDHDQVGLAIVIGLTGTTGIGITEQIAKVITHRSIDW